MKNLHKFDGFDDKVNENAEYTKLANQLTINIGEESAAELNKKVKDINTELEWDVDAVRYICYRMLVDCNDSKLAMAFVKLCNEIQ